MNNTSSYLATIIRRSRDLIRSNKGFTKYRDRGDYHWQGFYQRTKYRRHALKIMNWITEKNVLDVGAGDGLITFLIGASGIDIEPEAVRIARKKGVRMKLGDAYNIPLKDAQFEAVLMADVLEHLENTHKALSEVKRVLKEDGFLYITTPPKDLTPGKILDEFHFTEWSPEELKTLLEKEGFKLIGDIEAVIENKSMYAKFQKVA